MWRETGATAAIGGRTAEARAGSGANRNARGRPFFVVCSFDETSFFQAIRNSPRCPSVRPSGVVRCSVRQRSRTREYRSRSERQCSRSHRAPDPLLYPSRHDLAVCGLRRRLRVRDRQMDPEERNTIGPMAKRLGLSGIGDGASPGRTLKRQRYMSNSASPPRRHACYCQSRANCRLGSPAPSGTCLRC